MAYVIISKFRLKDDCQLVRMVFLNRDAPVASVGQPSPSLACADLDVWWADLTVQGNRLLFDQGQRCLANRQPTSWLTLQAAATQPFCCTLTYHKHMTV